MRYEGSSARDILLLAAEDAFEFERWRDAGPVTADIDAEVKAAEIAEFEALGIPMPSELDGLRRELEHAPKVRDAIRMASLALRRSGRVTASSLVALAPQQLMPVGAGAPWGWPMPPMDPRLTAHRPTPERAEVRRPRSRVAAATEVGSRSVAFDDGPVEAEVLRGEFDDEFDDGFADDGFADDGFEFDAKRDGKRDAKLGDRVDVVDRLNRVDRVDRVDDVDDVDDVGPTPRRRPAKSRRAKPSRAQTNWDEDEDEPFDSAVAMVAPRSEPKSTWILGGVSVALVLMLLWIALDKRDESVAPVVAAQPQAPVEPAAALPPAPPPVEPVAAFDPATGLPLNQVPLPEQPPTPTGRRSSGVSGVRSSSTASAPVMASGGGVNPFAGYKTDAVAGTAGSPGAQPAPGAATSGATAPAGTAPAAAPAGAAATSATSPGAAETTPGAAGPAPAPGSEPAPAAAPGAEAPAAEPPKPVEEPKPELTKSKMTPAIRQAVIGRVGDLQACYQDAVVGKPDLAGEVLFTISLDQDGVVKKVEVTKDEVKFGVAKCSAKKIQRWTLPSAGIPIIFDLPFDFKS